VQDTVGTLEIPAKPILDLKEFIFPPEILLQQKDDQLGLKERFVGLSAHVYNPFERLSYFIHEDRNSIYDHVKKVRYDLLGDLSDVSSVKTIP